jgi:hypothetical protein
MVSRDRVTHDHVVRAILEYDRLGPERLFGGQAVSQVRPTTSPGKPQLSGDGTPATQ